VPLFGSRRDQARNDDGRRVRALRADDAKDQARLDAMHARVQIEAKLRDIGQIVYGIRTDRSAPGDEAEIDRLVEEIRLLEFPR
jgi:hypothetical protein